MFESNSDFEVATGKSMEKADAHQAYHDLLLYICLLHRNAKKVIFHWCGNITFEIYFMHPILSNISLFFLMYELFDHNHLV